jgi:protoheme IX farnesyltransferase
LLSNEPSPLIRNEQNVPLSAYVELTKPRIALMVVVTAAIGYFLAITQHGISGDVQQFLVSMLGIALAGGGASVLNQYIERDVDSKMERTKNRPLVTGVISPAVALYLGVFMALGGCFLLLFYVNMLAAFLVLQSTFLYVLVYTPMKRLTWWNTSVGAIPGAMPPLMGWAAATGGLDAGAWILFAVMYIWQHPHFFAIAWMYREDYERGGLKMLPVVKPDGKNMSVQVIGFSLLMIPVSLVPTFIDMSGWVYFVGALILGLGFLASGIVFVREKSRENARSLMRVSLIYLPLLLIIIAIDSVMHVN